MYFQKFISMILAVALTLSLYVASVPPAYAVTGEEIAVTAALAIIYDDISEDISSLVDFEFSYIGPTTSERFNEILDDYNRGTWFSKFLSRFPNILDLVDGLGALFSGRIPYGMMADVAKDSSFPNGGVYRLRYHANGAWIVDKNGNFPYVPAAEYEAASRNHTVSAEGMWCDFQATQKNAIEWVPQSEAELGTRMVKLKEFGWQLSANGGDGMRMSTITLGGVLYKCIRNIFETADIDGDKVWCDPQGRPYVVPLSSDMMASQNTIINNYNQVVNKTENDITYNKVTNIDNSSNDDNKVIIDFENSEFNVFNEYGDRITQYIDSVTFDNSSHSYTVNTYDYTYNTTNNYFEYNYYTYNIQYTYTNTYITYIGSTAEYQPKEWELYYELPDGRSSADLTEEDVAGLSFQFADCINYKKSATDTALRALYHFDGNTNDAGFFSDKTSFAWNSGASITYMESNAFNGALYLDEKAHKFTITLPSKIGTGDFTLQWRYYQNSATTTDHNENYVMVGGTKLMGWSEQSLYNGSGTKLTGLSVGTWQELAIVRNKGTVYLYHNGVKIGSVSSSSVLTDKIIFYFGANSRAHSMLDEMRFVKGALYTGGKAYTPTAVPFDTNAVLVLPDSSVPVVDNYWIWDKTVTPIDSYDFSVYSGYQSGTYVPYKGSNVYPLIKYMTASSYTYVYQKDAYYFTDDIFSFSAGFYCGGTSFNVKEDMLSIVNSNSTPVTTLSYVYSSAGNTNVTRAYSFTDGIFYLLPVSCVSGTSLTLDLLFSDKQTSSFSFSLPPITTSMDYIALRQSFSVRGLTFKLYSYYMTDNLKVGSYRYMLHISGSGDLLYMDLVEGSKGNTNHQYITAEYDPTELQPNTAAIQTDIPINGYTVGGVRPTFPQRGNVWFAVEGSRISGVQVYNGQAWEEVNARWWTGSRWIPIYAFDLVTLSDMWDITSADGSGDVTPPITSETGFWNWWKKAWNDFTGKLFGILGDGPGSGPGSGSGSGSDEKGFFDKIIDALGDGIAALIRGLFNVVTEIFKLLLSVVTDMLSAIFSFVTDTVLGGIKSFFAFFTDGSLFDFFRGTETVIDPDGNEVEVVVATLPEGIAVVFSIFAGIVMLLPWELRSLLIFGVAAAVLIGVFKLTRA